MKKLFIIVLAALISYSGCKNNADKKSEISNEQKVKYWWTSLDEELDTKAQVKIDTVLFRQYMDKKLPPEKIFELFGSGYHNFYLALTILKENESIIILSTDAAFWQGNGQDTHEFLYKDGKRLPNFMVSSSKTSESKKVRNYVPFGSPDFDMTKVFKVKPGILKGKETKSVKLFEISVIINSREKVVRPWLIHEVEISKYKEHIYEKDVNRYWYSTGLPAVSVDGFESVRKAIKYPELALKNGVTGRVIVQLFADVDGNFAGYQLLKGLGYGCDEAVINAITTVKPHTFSMGQRSSIIVPFEFGLPKSSPIDLAVQLFDVNTDPNVYNNIRLGIVNKNTTDKDIDKKYFIYVYMDKHLVFQTQCSSISKRDLQQIYWFRFHPEKPGTYEYTIYLDPENILNDSNRENNTVKGTVTIR